MRGKWGFGEGYYRVPNKGDVPNKTVVTNKQTFLPQLSISFYHVFPNKSEV